MQGNLYGLLGRFGRRAGLRDLVRYGEPEAWATGPRLADAAYPEVLVARAVTDGQALDAVLHPGAGPGRTRVRVDRLRPGRRYAVRGAVEHGMTAAEDGTALLTLDLHGRTELRVVPAP